MAFRVGTLNLEQDHKRWDLRRELVITEIGAVRPDVLALNEVCVPRQTARWLQKEARARYGIEYHLIQQTKVNASATLEGEALLARFPVIETANLDYRARDMIALVARVIVHDEPVDVYVTHLYMSRGDDSLRLFQVQQLLAWIDSRDDVAACIVCGDFNATFDRPSAALMATRFRATQTSPTAFTALADVDGEVSHTGLPRMDRCIDYIWLGGPLRSNASRVCFNQPSASDSTLWPSDHAGLWADVEFVRSD